MPRRLLIDASHREQIRVVVLENGRVVEYDGETASKQQIKGNIYLAKVTRIEPSLQAAFVEYGGRKHGFLPFSEIHPDYYQIPAEDRQKLLAAMGGLDEEEDDDIDNGDAGEDDEKDVSESGGGDEKDNSGSEQAIGSLLKRYKIQDVIKRGQVLLLQAEKEERGNKGASFTSFISLAGKYCVFMPKSLKKGGVSRKIASGDHRRKLKDILASLNMLQGAGLIIRTAGAGKSQKQITADYDYLAELWNAILKATYSSCAPAFIHAEEDVVRRSIRDMYDDSYDEALIEGREAYASARQFIEKIIPESEAKVRLYEGKLPLFSRFKVEEQINALYEHSAPLESGGSIVLSPTEALVSIDVNSGKSTSQRDVEETALSTNLEAAREIARQLKLRDLSGLIVIDFIDMLDYRNRRAVERAVKEAFSDDRARVQIGRISNFGLLEMSRQRLRPTLWEMTTQTCPTCRGTGAVKAPGAVAVQVLRAIEQECVRSNAKALKITLHIDVATYILNHKRSQMARLEEEYGLHLMFAPQYGDKQSKNAYSVQRMRFSKDAEEGPATDLIDEDDTEDMTDRDPARDFAGGRRPDKRRAADGFKDDADGGGRRRERAERPESGRVSARAERNRQYRAAQAQRPGGFTQVLEGIWQKIID